MIPMPEKARIQFGDQRSSFLHALMGALLAISMLALGKPTACGAETTDGIFANPLMATSLDRNVFTQWVDGSEKPVELKGGPQDVIWARGERIEWSGVNF